MGEQKTAGRYMTWWYSLLHLMVDGICAFAMFGRFLTTQNQVLDLLLYNFCAFALQMPFGLMLDMQVSKNKNTLPCFVAVLGVLCTLLGTVTHPIVLGTGNALFHIGGGVGTIYEDSAQHWNGKGLGIFVAPGALGLYLGTLAAKNNTAPYWLWAVCIGMLLCGAAACRQAGKQCHHSISETGMINSNPLQRPAHALSLCCLLVVILRSYLGMTVTFSWKTSVFGGLIAVLAIVLGKAAGGILAARYGILQVSTVSLLMAAITYLGAPIMPFGAAALFLFNITMPITLNLMVRHYPHMPGFSFGFLTFGLFLGFLPACFGLPAASDGHMTACAGSVLSLLILYAGIRPKSC